MLYSDLLLSHCCSPDVLVLPSRPLFSTTRVADLPRSEELRPRIESRQMEVLREVLLVCQERVELQLTPTNIHSLRMMLARTDSD